MEPGDEPHYSGPGLRDWLLVVASGAFVVCGLVLLPRSPEKAVPCIAFFGACAALAGASVVRKRRFSRLRALSVEIAGGAPIRPSRARLALMSATLSSLGALLLFYWRSAPIYVVLSVLVILLAGVLLGVGLLTGRLPVGFLQFDPAGITIGRRRDSFVVPWDAIAGVAPGEFHDNPVLLLSIRDLARLVVRPPEARRRVLAALASNVEWFGAHVMIMTSQYAIDLPLLVKAIERYTSDPSTRAALGVPRLAAARSE